jgi:osmoprotectant transport system substrate-binding protein
VRSGTAAVSRAAIVVVLSGALVACSRSHATPVPSSDAIRIASFNFPESELLAEMYGQALAGAGLPVKLELNLGPRELVMPALERGLVDLVPEYGGSALDFVSLGRTAATADAARTHALLAAAMAQRGIDVLDASAARDENGFAVTAATARDFGLRTISDLAAFASRMTFGGPVECPQRPLCLPGLRAVYGLRFASFSALDTSGPLTTAALTSGQVDVALIFTTAAQIDADHLVLLEDDRGLEPAENVTPVVRSAVIERYGPKVAEVVDSVSRALTTSELRRLNGELASGGATPASVARGWLADHGLIPSVG